MHPDNSKVAEFSELQKKENRAKNLGLGFWA
jgi:hypothetical protein